MCGKTILVKLYESQNVLIHCLQTGKTRFSFLVILQIQSNDTREKVDLFFCHILAGVTSICESLVRIFKEGFNLLNDDTYAVTKSPSYLTWLSFFPLFSSYSIDSLNMLFLIRLAPFIPALVWRPPFLPSLNTWPVTASPHQPCLTRCHSSGLKRPPTRQP